MEKFNLKIKKEFIRKIIGCMLIFGSLYLSYWWFYKLSPLRHLVDTEWLENHSSKAYWNEEQKKYRRLNSSPDLCICGDRIGYYGNKKWTEWLIHEMQNPDFRVCGCTETALMYMTNKHVSSWTDWLRKNKDKSQEEWIQKGFEERGLKIHIPAKNDDIESLLNLLGRETWHVLWKGPQNEKKTQDTVPSYMKYNAFRWLRDSGFDPLKYSLTQSDIPENLRKGLLEYEKWNRSFSIRDGVGILFIGDDAKTEEVFFTSPPITQAKYIAIVYALIISTFIGGALLIILPKKNRENL